MVQTIGWMESQPIPLIFLVVDGGIISANATVVKNVELCAIYGGNPAK